MGKVKLRNVLLLGLAITAGAIAVAAASGAILKHPPPIEKLTSSSSLPSSSTPLEALGESQSKSSTAEHYNLLLCGVDKSPNNQSSADFIIYVSLDTKTKKITLLQIPEDIFVGESYATGRLKEAYLPFSGDDPTPGISKILAEQMGLQVDGWVAITLEGISGFVEEMGGIKINLPQPLQYGEGKSIPAGESTLTPEQSQELLRYNKGSLISIPQRQEAQRLFLQSVFTRVQSMSKLEALKLAARCYSQVKTNVDFTQLTTLMGGGLNLSGDNITMLTLPVHDAKYKEYTVLYLEPDELAALLNTTIRVQNPVEATDLKLQRPTEK